MKADTSGLTKPTPTKSASSTTAKAARSTQQGPLPGKGPWFRLDGVWYTQDEAGEWVIMPGQRKAKGLKRLKPADIPS
ncbi:hypothetical protein [Spirosoma endophyticum]|uniref:hypothetical protein n=1 Tax=Spirosoma endophyticum TaxID=662367 RepID=UPI001160310D|nr:hypothetical protein [Spirosoma endophyticum]